MIRFSWSKMLFLLLSSTLSFLSCTSSLDDTPVINNSELHEVTVTLMGINFTLEPTRASDATPSEAGITHIALKVFDSDGAEAASITQTSSVSEDDFNNLKVQLPAGTYTFVAVAHSATKADVPCATVTSPTEATLPEGIVPTLYTRVQTVTISNSNNQSVLVDMGKRVNATLHFTSTDIVPEDVAQMNVEINPSGTSVRESAPAKFNPSTGSVIGDRMYGRKLPFSVGKQLDASFNILLPADSYFYTVFVSALDKDKNTIANYTRTFENVPFQKAFTTNANGTYFRYVTTSSLMFDLSTETLDFDL
ncbi:MAG: FimB/Mfa2 family fimbrial subunit [Bacteroidales bacterium]|nr:FimB/Mfa2 family fimbrial subunit [Bacteroidales bacterium]